MAHRNRGSTFWVDNFQGKLFGAVSEGGGNRGEPTTTELPTS